MADNVDYGLLIPESDQEFVILPDKTKIRFTSTSLLVKYLDDEIEVWKDRDCDIQNRYIEAKDELDRVIKSLKGNGLEAGNLQLVKDLLADGEITQSEIRYCIYSESKLGRLLLSYAAEHRDWREYWAKASAACCVALGYDVFYLDVDGAWMLAAADAVVRFRAANALADDVSSYRKELESLAALNLKYRTDKSAFDADRKKQFEDDNAKFAEHLKAADDSAKKFEQDYQNRIGVLEETYTKLLQLKGPAEYWDELAKSYRSRGWWLLGAVVLIGVVVFGSLLALLFDCDKLPLLNHVKFDAATVRASLIFIVLTSVAGYLLHLFTRLSISSFHLARDYRERFQLTRVYLALIKDGDIQNEESTRQIILQSIFSRSDTGLLKGDHALTMPGVGELVKGNG